MKAVYLDCFSGISGNMLLGAFLEAGVPEDYLVGELGKLPIRDSFAFHHSLVEKCGIHASYVDVELTGDGGHCHHHHDYNHEAEEGYACCHRHDHEHRCEHKHDENVDEKYDCHHGHEHHHAPHSHRSMADIRAMIEGSELSSEVKETALKVFTALAEVEGKVHNRPPEEVTFHEVGAVDSIVDIVGTAICLDYLDVEKVFASAVNTGSGTVECAHGTMPVPAPATAELLLGWPSYHRDAEKELTTPTGAAVLHALAEYSDGLPGDFLAERIAYGAGGWDLPTPNVLRLYVGTYQGTGASSLFLLETNIDDMNPQIYGYLYDKLLSAGALDVWTTPIYMKKNRPAEMLSVLTDEEHKDALTNIVFRESTSIGLRVLPVAARLEAKRRVATAQTKYGEVHLKISAWGGHIVSISAEYEDCRRLAEAHDVPLKAVQHEALREMYRRLGD